jgi:serine/threonine-protein kinase
VAAPDAPAPAAEPAEPAAPAAAPAEPAAPAAAPAEPAAPAAAPAEPAAEAPAAAPDQAPDGMVEVPGGRYPIGCHAQLDGCQIEATPLRHRPVRRFAIDQQEVTVARYLRCVEAGACPPLPRDEGCNGGERGRAAYPVNCVSQREAALFCAWEGARLPSEVEWEVAARGPQQRRYPWGSQHPSCRAAALASYDGPGCGTGMTLPAGAPAGDVSWCGVRGLGGNVAEWTASPFAAYPGATAPTAVQGEAAVRGGHFQHGARELPLVYQRGRARPETRRPTIGFRCATDLLDHQGRAGGQ